MDEDKKMGKPLTGPPFDGTEDQARALSRWKKAGWTFIHWTEVPKMMAIMEGGLGEIIFIDRQGLAWQGPTFSKSKPVPLEKYPPVNDCVVT